MKNKILALLLAAAVLTALLGGCAESHAETAAAQAFRLPPHFAEARRIPPHSRFRASAPPSWRRLQGR